MKISYAIPVCNEHYELDRLLSGIIAYMEGPYEIVVQCDEGNTTDEVRDVLKKHQNKIKVVQFPLNKDFASFKNHLKGQCTGDWIIQVDADEELTQFFLENIYNILDSNQEVDVFLLPRINTVDGLTDQHISKWKWQVDQNGRVNFPDWQTRILKNVSSIQWKNKVHEVLSGYVNYTYFPTDEELCIIHRKTIERQERQNESYAKI